MPNNTLTGKKVLVIDDDSRNIFAVSSFLESEDMEVVSETSGQEGINRLKDSDDIDVILMDIKMPGMDGYEAIRRIRQDADFSTIPIIAVTGKANAEERDRCVSAGATDYVSKPIDLDRLITLLQQVVAE